MENAGQEWAPLVYESRIKIPYAWSAGEVASRFLVALRDEERILGTRCGSCQRVFVPPKKRCPRCFAETSEWTEVGPAGTVTALTIVETPNQLQPFEPRYAYGLIRLDGADTGLLHCILSDDLSAVSSGCRVRAVFSDERTGSIRDISHFEPVAGERS